MNVNVKEQTPLVAAKLPSNLHMLSEDHVVDSVCLLLESLGYTIKHRSYTRAKGHDIHATHPTKADIVVEAKGEGSNTPTSRRYGKTFTKGQVNDHVGRALLRALHSKAKGLDSGVAFPSDTNHRNEIEPIRELIKKAGVRIFFVDKNKSTKEI